MKKVLLLMAAVMLIVGLMAGPALAYDTMGEAIAFGHAQDYNYGQENASPSAQEYPGHRADHIHTSLDAYDQGPYQ